MVLRTTEAIIVWPPARLVRAPPRVKSMLIASPTLYATKAAPWVEIVAALAPVATDNRAAKIPIKVFRDMVLDLLVERPASKGPRLPRKTLVQGTITKS